MKIFFCPKKLNCLVFTLIYFLSTCITVFCQEQKVVADLAMWTEIKMNKSIIKNLQFSVSQHFRFNKNISSFEDYIADAELQYSINKNFSIGTNGRYTRNKHYNQIVENDYRYDLNFEYDSKIRHNLKFYYRLKYQKEYYGSSVFNQYLNYHETTYRNRIKFGWEFNKNHQLYSSAEIFRQNKQSRDFYFSKYRLFFGDDISTRMGEFDAAFGFEQELNSVHPLTCYIFKLAYQFTL
ncbi:MAG TPA: DUF2490 domain-containing protein [Prolixibacteraceae bacterium]|nr:DUF2490 domain-containing protein [Prolixibacteraceae bacterium]